MQGKIHPTRHYLDGIEKEILSRGDTPKFPITSLPEFNHKVWGMKCGMTVVGARTSNGKSAFAGQLAWDFANQGMPVLFLSLR